LLHFALKQVRLQYRQCVILQIVEEYSQHEIAELVGISESSVSTYVRRGLDKLRQICILEHERSVPKKGR
jgi:RNA polymerase sigma-70 factor, ECF subfamily